MKTLVIVSHPDILESSSQQFFLSAIHDRTDVTIHHLESVYPDGNIDVKKEQTLLREHDRIVFQFPFYWYSSPPLLKHWQDVVLEEGFAYGEGGEALKGKEFRLIMMIGVPEKEYQAGGSELFSINELTKPFQAMAHKTGMIYLKPMPIFQFGYLTDKQKMEHVITYWQMLTMKNDDSLRSREEWLIEQLEYFIAKGFKKEYVDTLRYAIQIIQENRMEIDNLQVVLDDIRRYS